MVYAIFSDIHGNLEALKACFGAFSHEKVDSFLCIGDIVGYGADPVKCIDMTKSLKPVVVSGNHEAACTGASDIKHFSEGARKAIVWTREQLRSEDITYMQGLSPVYENEELTLVHGTLEEPWMFNYMFDVRVAAESCRLLKTQILFVGHSHVPGIFSSFREGRIRYSSKEKAKLLKGEKLIVNVGSVGQPRDGDPRGSYCMYDSDKGIVEIKRVEYDVEKAKEKIRGAGLPTFLANRLERGV